MSASDSNNGSRSRVSGDVPPYKVGSWVGGRTPEPRPEPRYANREIEDWFKNLPADEQRQVLDRKYRR